ncbi:hypothetical protein JHK86_026402 [Glycine max]|nr:hypothetical protein JHK86_026402 [Glycine max]
MLLHVRCRMGKQKPQGLTRHSTLVWEGTGPNQKLQNSQRGMETLEDILQQRHESPPRFGTNVLVRPMHKASPNLLEERLLGRGETEHQRRPS